MIMHLYLCGLSNRVKPKPQQVKKDREIVDGDVRSVIMCMKAANCRLISTCPLCGHDKDDFEPIYKRLKYIENKGFHRCGIPFFVDYSYYNAVIGWALIT